MKKIGDLLRYVPVVKAVPKRVGHRTIERIIEASRAIEQDPDAVELAYMARQLVICTLPHRNPGDVPVWSRRNGRATLGLVPGMNIDTGESYGYPYGILPRLVLFWISTEVVRQPKAERSRRLHLGHSLAAFMKALNLDPEHGGKKSDAYRLKEQMLRLFRCRISFQESASGADGSEGLRWKDMPVAPEGELWWNPRQPEQGALWGSWIELGEKFYDAILAAPVPVDMRALRALKSSPLALDLYAFLTHRVFNLKTPQFVPWKGLQEQVGTDYASVDEFARYAKSTLKKVQGVYPNLKVQPIKGGFYVYPSPVAVPAKLVSLTLP